MIEQLVNNALETIFNEEHIGFKALAEKVGSKALAAYIGNKKYGKKKMQKAAKNKTPLSDEDAKKKKKAA